MIKVLDQSARRAFTMRARGKLLQPAYQQFVPILEKQSTSTAASAASSR